MIITHYELILPLHQAEPAVEDRKEKFFSIAVLSDLHDDPLGNNYGELLREMDKAGVCAVLSAGDLITVAGMAAKTAGRGRGKIAPEEGQWAAQEPAFPPRMEHALALISLLAKRYPVYLCNGNHEMRLKQLPQRYPGWYERYLHAVTDAGAHVLDNASRKLRVGKDTVLRITGYSMELKWYDRFHKQHMTSKDVRAAVGRCKKGDHMIQILLAHHPDYFPAYAGWGADLVLSGHLHGGMIRLPVAGGVIGGTLRPFPKYDKGLFTLQAKERCAKMAVSAGLGQHTLNLRWNNPPELVILDFYRYGSFV